MANRSLIVGNLLAILLCLSISPVGAQDYVGILPEMLKPEVSDQIGLSEEQREQVQDLIRKRTSAAIGLSQQLREAPLDQHDSLRADFSAASEQMAFSILDDGQKAKLATYRVSWLGLLSLADPQVAKALNLADWQQEIVGEWQSKVRQNRRGNAAARVRAEAEQAIRREISESQWAAWQLMAGKISESNSGEPMPPVREVVAEVADESSSAEVAAMSPSDASNRREDDVDNSSLAVEDVRLELNFQAMPWGDVIKWLAAQADLSLQTDLIPPGTFTYRDRSRQYSVTEAMDILNGSLLSTGHTMVRSSRILRVVNFEDQDVAGEFIAEIADYVTEDELARRGDYEPVKHIFSLSRLDPETFKEEVEQLLSLQGTIRSIPSTGQLIVTDMAKNVRAIQKMIQRAEDPNSSRGSSIQTMPLKHISAEEILSVARPLLELEEGANTSDDIRISTDTFGTVIYVKGSADKVQNLRDLVLQMDVPPQDSEAPIEYEVPELRRHRVVGIDLELSYQIISQLLAGAPDVRLAQDEKSSQLMLMARPSEHKLVEDTLRTLAGEASDFQVIQLEKLDTQMAIAAIKKFFSLTDDADGEGGGPVIDGDLLARQVWVKGSASQVEQISEFLTNLEKNAANSNILGDSIISIPISGRAAQTTLEQVRELWEAQNNPNRIRTWTSSGSGVGVGSGAGLQQKSSAPEVSDKEARAMRGNRSGDFFRPVPVESEREIPAGRLASFPQQAAAEEDVPGKAAGTKKAAENVGADILIMEGPGGLIVASDDKEALARFEAMMRLFADQAAFGSSDPTVIYLTNIKAAAAKELLETILSGSSSSGGGGGGLLGDMAGSMLGGLGGGMFGAMMGGGGGDLLSSGTGMASGDYTITADPRLNALIVKASAADMSLIEQLLEVIDQVESPIAIATQGQVAMIEVITQDVAQVVTMIKGLYGERIEGNSSASRGGGGGGGGQPNPADIINALRGGRGGGGGGGATELAEAKISIASDEKTNMLFVRGQPQDIEEIRKIVAMVDEAGAADQEELGFAALDGMVNATVFQESVTRLLGPSAQANVVSKEGTTSTAGGTSTPAAGGGEQSDAQQQAQRAAFFERLRSSGAFGGGRGGDTGGRGGATGGGAPGGRGGFGGGGRGGR